MSLLALLAANSTPTTDPTPDPGTGEWPDYDPPADTTPYAFPTTSPYNAPTWCPTPTPDGSGEVIHPSVIDFLTQHGMTNWNGYRYWLGITGFKDEQSFREDPLILASHDGFTWQVPAGLINPIADAPGAPYYYSDTELVFEGGKLYCYWREAHDGTISEFIHVAWSLDGSAWIREPSVLSATNPGGKTIKILSPAVQQYGPSDWRMVTIGASPDAVPEVRYASSPLGPFTGAVPLTLTYLGTTYGSPWHFTQTRVDGVSYGLIYVLNPATLVTCTSVDGAVWSVSDSRPVVTRSGQFDAKFYRAAFAPHEDGVNFRLWYPVNSQHASTLNDWRLAYTVVPRSLWPTPPA